MQDVFVKKPYQFVPRYRSRWQQRWLLKTRLLHRTLRKREGIVDQEVRGAEKLKASIDAGHGVMLAPNHPRTADPMAIYHVARELNEPFYVMASWHLFNRQDLALKLTLKFMGAFSVNREGPDRQAIEEAIEILSTADRPLIVFAEGTTSRTNDQLMELMEGPAFIARRAAKKRKKTDDGKVVIHPVAIRYLYQGDIESTAESVLTDVEKILTWSPQRHLGLIERIHKVGDALLKLKEVEYNVESPTGATLRQRQDALVKRLLNPLEQTWLGRTHEDDGVAVRIKNLRVQIFPELCKNSETMEQEEHDRRWQGMVDSYLAQQVDQYPDNYVASYPSVDRILETLEKFEEDLTDQARLHGDLKAVIEVGDAIEVSPVRPKGQTADPIMAEIRQSLESMLTESQKECRMYSADDSSNQTKTNAKCKTSK